MREVACRIREAHRARLPEDEEQVAEESRRDGAEGAERYGAPRVAQIAREVGALHHADDRREDDPARDVDGGRAGGDQRAGQRCG
eukprot:4564893-Prymnesium_polylepis.1